MDSAVRLNNLDTWLLSQKANERGRIGGGVHTTD